VTSLVSCTPCIGGILGLHGICLGVVGIREVHNTTTGKEAAVLIAAVILLVLALITLVCAFLFFGNQQ
jgi:hypothetical protein